MKPMDRPCYGGGDFFMGQMDTGASTPERSLTIRRVSRETINDLITRLERWGEQKADCFTWNR